MLLFKTFLLMNIVVEKLLFEAQLLRKYGVLALQRFLLHERRGACLEHTCRGKPQLG